MRYTDRPIFIPFQQNSIPWKPGQTAYHELDYAGDFTKRINPTTMPNQNDTPYVPPKEAVLFQNLVADYERYLSDGQPEVANECLTTLIGAIRRHLYDGESFDVITRQGKESTTRIGSGGILYGPTYALIGEPEASVAPDVRVTADQLIIAFQRGSRLFNQIRKVANVDPYNGPSLEKLKEVLGAKTPEIGAGDLVFLNEGFDGSTYIVQFIDGERIRIRPCREIASGKAGLYDRIVHQSELGFIRKAGDFPAITAPDRERTETSPQKPEKEIDAGDLVFDKGGFDGNMYVIQGIDRNRANIRDCRGGSTYTDRMVELSSLCLIRKAGDFPSFYAPQSQSNPDGVATARENTNTSRAEPG